MTRFLRNSAVATGAALLMLATGCGKAGNTGAPASTPGAPVTTLQANVIARVTCDDAPWALDLDVKKRKLAEFLKLKPIKQQAKGNCQLEYQPVDQRIQVVVLIKPGDSANPADWTVDATNAQDAGFGIGKDDVAYLLIHGENLGAVKVPNGEDIKLGPNLTAAQQAKNIEASTLYQHARHTWK